MKLLAQVLAAIAMQSYSVTPTEQGTQLFVFVGERLSVEEVPPKPDELPFDHEFSAKFKIIQPVFGSFDGEVINFRVFDHHGRPQFENYKHSLMFVTLANNGQYYHEKYQFYDVYPTHNGRWATCGGPYRKSPEVHRHGRKAEEIDFVDKVSYDLSDFLSMPKDQQDWYMANTDIAGTVLDTNFFEIRDNRAYCKGWGVYAEDLFKAKSEGVLKARGLFK